MTKTLHCHPSLLIYCVELVYAPAVLGVLRVAIMLKRWPMFFCWKTDPIQKETLYTYVCIESFPSVVLCTYLCAYADWQYVVNGLCFLSNVFHCLYLSTPVSTAYLYTTWAYLLYVHVLYIRICTHAYPKSCWELLLRPLYVSMCLVSKFTLPAPLMCFLNTEDVYVIVQ